TAIRGIPLAAFSARMRPTAAMIARARDAFNIPQRMLQPPAIRQALIDNRNRLMLGAITPHEFAQRIETAAAADRARAAAPDAIEYRHAFAGTALLVVLAAIALWLASGRWRARRATLRASAQPTAKGGRVVPNPPPS